MAISTNTILYICVYLNVYDLSTNLGSSGWVASKLSHTENRAFNIIIANFARSAQTS
jgi:hypothetical protein